MELIGRRVGRQVQGLQLRFSIRSHTGEPLWAKRYRTYRASQTLSLLVLVGEDLARIHDAVWVGEPLDSAHERQGVPMLSLQVLDLAGTNPVLAGAGAAACECIGDYLLVHRLCPLYIGLILCIHREEGVVVAVAYMSQDRPVQTSSLYGFAGMPQGSRQIGDRDAYIGSHHAFIGKEAVYREGSLVACLPEFLPSRFVFLNRFTASTLRRSTSSTRPICMPLLITATTARDAASTLGNTALAASTLSGRG